MSDTRVGIIVQLTGDSQAASSLQNLARTVNELNGRKIDLKMDNASIDREINTLRRSLDYLTTRRAEIRLQSGDVSRVEGQIRGLQSEIDKLVQTKKLIQIDFQTKSTELSARINDLRRELDRLLTERYEIKLSGGNTAEITKDIRNIRDEIRALLREKEDVRIDFRVRTVEIDTALTSLRSKLRNLEDQKHEIKLQGGQVEELERQILEIKSKIDDLTRQKKDIQIDADVNNTALREAKSLLSDMERQAYTIQDVFNGIGTAFQTIGSGLSGFAGMTQSLGSAFSSMADLFSTDIMDYALQKLTWMGTSALTSNIQEASSRYDILRTYDEYLAIMGVNADTAAESLDKINANIQGLPIGLDKAAYQAKQFNMYLGDMEKATNLAIGLDKALIAGGAPEQMRRYAEYEVQRLLIGGELNTKRQWAALLNGLGVSTEFLKREMGYSDLSTTDFLAKLTGKEISGQEFLEGVMKLSSAESLESALDIYRTTIESGLSNIHFAVTRGMANVMGAANDVLQDTTGKQIADYLMDVRNAMNEAFGSISDWVGAHGDTFAEFIERIATLFDKIKGFDWGGLGEKIFENLGEMLDLFAHIIDRIPEGALEEFVAFAMTWAGPLGKAFQMISNGLPILLGVFERMKDFDWAHLADTVLTEIGRVAEIVANILNKIPDSVLEKLITFGLVYAGPLGMAFNKLGGFFHTLALIKWPSGGLFNRMGKSLTGLGNSIGTWKNFGIGAATLGTFLAAIAAVGLIIKEYAWIAEYISQRDFSGFDKNFKPVMTMAAEMAAFVGGLTAAFTALTKAGLGKDVIAGELMTGGYEALLAGMGGIIAEYTKIAETIGQANLSGDFDANVEKVSSMVRNVSIVIGAVVAGVGVLTGATGGAGALFGAVGELLAGGFVEILRGVGEVLDEFVDIANHIATSEFPTAAKLDEAKEALTGLANLFSFEITAIDTYAIEQLSAGMEILKGVGDNLDVFTTLSAADMTADIETAKNNVVAVGEMLEELYGSLADSFGEGRKGVRGSKNMGKTVENMTGVVENLGLAANAMEAIRDDVQRLGIQFDENGDMLDTSALNSLKRRIEEVGKALGEIFEATKEAFGGADWWTKRGTENEAGIIGNMNAAFENLRQVMVTMFTLRRQLKGLGAAGEIGTYTTTDDYGVEHTNEFYREDAFQGFKRQLTELVDGISEIGDHIAREGGVLKSKAESIKTSYETLILANYNSILTVLGNIITLFSSLDPSIAGVGVFPDSNGPAVPSDAFSETKNKIVQLIDGVGEIADAISERSTVIGKKFETLIRAYENIDLQTMASSLEKIGEIAEIVKDLGGKLDWYTDSGQLATISSKYSSFMEQIASLFGELGVTGGLGANATDNNYGNLSTNVRLLKDSMDDIASLAWKINDIYPMIQQLGDLEPFGTFTTGLATAITELPADAQMLATRAEEIKTAVMNMQSIIDTLYNFMPRVEALTQNGTATSIHNIISGVVGALAGNESIAGRFEQVAMLSEMMQTLNTAFTNLANVDISGLIGQIASLNEQLDAVAGKLATVAENMGRASTQALNLRNNVGRLATTLGNYLGAISNFASRLGAITFAAANAAAMVNSLRAAINSLPTQKTVTLTMNTINTRSVSEGGAARPSYRALGGPIFAPRGTDTVPAMLTPGEYVMRRNAVKAFGEKFMERVNALDIPGAFDALASKMTAPNPSTYVINNTKNYDNHATVNQNIYTDNPMYSQRKAYKFARALG